jgi:exodeoxyribonuclease X
VQNSRATTFNTLLGFRSMMSNIPIMTGGMGELKLDGRNRHKVTDWKSLTYVVVDVEGNGRQPPELVELAIVPIQGGAIGEPMSWLVKPDRSITHFARTIHGISNKDIADAPTFGDVQPAVLAALNAHSLKANALIAHNAHVDVSVLQRYLPNWECPQVFDALTLARRILPEAKSYKLGALAQTFNLTKKLPHGLTPHRATYDVLVAAQLFIRLATLPNGCGRSLEDLQMKPRGKDDPQTLF